MLTEINLENFKCFRQLKLVPRRITVLIGANGSGKSSCLQALLMLKQSLRTNELVTHGEQVRLGEFGDILYRSNGGPAGRSLKMGMTAIALLEEPARLVFGDKVPYTYNLDFVQGHLHSQACRIDISQHGGIKSMFSNTKKDIKPSQLEIQGVLHDLGSAEPIGQPIYKTGFSNPNNVSPSELQSSMDAVNQLLSVFARTLNNIFLIPAIRGMDAEDYPLGDSDVLDFGEGASLDTRAARLTTTLAYLRELETILSEWLTRITGVKAKFPLVRKKRVTIKGGVHKPQFIMVNEGFGSNQLTFALAQLAISPKDSILCYEEPEIHLHPKAQSELANVLVEIAKQGEKQMMLTTHSEHILYGFLSNVAEGKLSPDELAIWYFSREYDKVGEPQELVVDERGRVEGGLRGFFEVELEQLERYFQALQKEE